ETSTVFCLRSLRSAKPCSLSRFLQNRQTFFAFFFFTVSLQSTLVFLKLNRDSFSAQPSIMTRFWQLRQTFRLFSSPVRVKPSDITPICFRT
ncbi:hypothetical protein, partial [Variovorax boronicumulans]|uniref:hypothetical protein n=1 Tax=Variovorax boronicumulans TaxID=436515 RepID=UPI001C5A5117